MSAALVRVHEVVLGTCRKLSKSLMMKYLLEVDNSESLSPFITSGCRLLLVFKKQNGLSLCDAEILLSRMS